MVGDTLSHYRLVEKIGSGGMGEVYRAHDEHLDRDVALKVLPVGTLASEAARKLFRKEALALARLNHPNIATVHEFDSQHGVDFLVMELIRGRSLKDILSNGPLTEAEILRLGSQLAAGLEAAHEHGVIHRDLKPANIMITPDGRLKILDFGLAKLPQVAGTEIVLSSRENNSMPGTLPYMAPEQLQGEPADEKTDVYGAGTVLYEMATGGRAFPETRVPRLIDSILNRPPLLPCELNPQLSSGTQEVILKTLEKDPADRYQSARELRSGLEKVGSAVVAAQPRALVESQASPLEIAHVLFMDLVAYSTMPMDQQRHRLKELQKTVQSTSEFIRAKAADQLISLPTGDGMALVFFGDSEAPVRCALELSRVLRKNPEIKLRMGINTGPVYRVADINADRNVSGGGINIAQRVMDCGDAGHILVSKSMVDVLGQLTSWNNSLHDLGEAEVKHGVRVHLFNLYTDEVGNPNRPSKLRTAKIPRNLRTQAEKKAETRGSGSGQPQGHSNQPAFGARLEAAPSSLRTLTGQVVLPQIRRRKWFFGAGTILALVGVILAIPSLRSRVLGVRTANPNPPKGVPSTDEGKFLAVLPFEVQGDANIAEGLNLEVSRKLSSLKDLHVASAEEAEGAAARLKIDLKGPVENTARALGANLVVQGTVSPALGSVHVVINLKDLWNRRALLLDKQFSSDVVGGPLTLADNIYRAIVTALKLSPSKAEEHRAANPTSSYAAYDFYLKGRSAFERRRNAQGARIAIGYYQMAVKNDGGFALAYAELANAERIVCRETGDQASCNTSLEMAKKATELNDELPEVHWALAAVYKEIGNSELAIQEYSRAKDLSPYSDDAYRRLGQAYRDSHQREKAIEALYQATQMNRFSLYNHNELGWAYIENGQYEEAIDEFRREIELDPNYFSGYLNVGNVYLLQAKYEEAISEYSKALQHNPGSEVYLDLGLAYLYVGHYTEAIENLQTAVDKGGGKEEKYVGYLADVYRLSGQKEIAKTTYDQAIKLSKERLDRNPNDSDVIDDLALYYANTGKFALADDYIARARSSYPSDADIMYDEARVRVTENQPTRAIDCLRSAFEGNGYLARQAARDPEFSAIKSRPEFKKLVDEFAPKSN